MFSSSAMLNTFSHRISATPPPFCPRLLAPWDTVPPKPIWFVVVGCSPSLVRIVHHLLFVGHSATSGSTSFGGGGNSFRNSESEARYTRPSAMSSRQSAHLPDSLVVIPAQIR